MNNDEIKYHEEKLSELRNNLFLELSEWWDSDTPGACSIIITNDKVLYYYKFYNYILEKNKSSKLSEGRIISDELFNELNNYIKNNIINKNFQQEMIFDWGCKVTCESRTITNETKIYKDLEAIIEKYYQNIYDF